MINMNKLFAQNLSEKDVASLVEKVRDNHNIPAMVVVIMNSENLLLTEIQGERISDSNNIATINDYFHLGSCSKSILTFMAGKLVEQGKISWDTKFLDLFPEFKNIAKSDYYNITLEDLFLCEAGIQPFTSGEEKFPQIDSSISNKRLEFVKYLIQQEPASKRTDKGFQYLYSNASYTMASAMLERASGQTWEELIKMTLTDELGLSFFLGWPNNYNSNQPWGHREFKGKLKSFPPNHEYRLPDLIAPAGDLSMKPLDYAKYVQLHLKGLTGVDKYLSSSSYKYIHFGHKGFSLGVANDKLGGKRFSNFDGSAGTFYCHTIIVPESDLAYVIMANSGAQKAAKGILWLSKKIPKKHYNWWWKFWM